MDASLLSNMANCSKIDRNFLLSVNANKMVYLFIKEGTHCTAPKVQCCGS
jgi:hypothetical protein